MSAFDPLRTFRDERLNLLELFVSALHPPLMFRSSQPTTFELVYSHHHEAERH